MKSSHKIFYFITQVKKKLNNLFFYIIIFFFTINTSCKKEIDEESPHIIITSPENTVSYSVLDTIPVKAEISDNEQLKTISCYVEDMNGTVINGISNFKASGRNFYLQTVVNINDIRVETGYYNIVVSASDGVNTDKSYKKIHLTTIPKQLQNVYFISTTDCNIYQLNNNNFELKKTLGFDVSDAKVLSYYDIMYVLDKSGNLHSLNIDKFTENWIIQGLNDPLHNYNGKLQIFENYCYVSTKESNIFAYDINGNVREKAISSNHAYQPGQFIITNSGIYHNIVSGEINQNLIERFNKNTGASISTNLFNYDLIDMFELNNSEIICFCNKNDSLYISRLGEMYNGERPFHCEFPQKINDVIKTLNKYLIATNTGLYSFDNETEYIINISSEFYANQIYYEIVNNNFYLTKQNELQILSEQDLSLIKSINIPEENGIILFDYNK